MARITCLRGDTAGSQYSLGYYCSLGTDRSNTIIVNGTGVLPKHAELKIRQGCIFLAPKGPVTLNGMGIKAESEIRPGDVFSIGGHEWKLESSGSPATSRMAPTPAPGEQEPQIRMKPFSNTLDVLETFQGSEKLQAHISTMYRVSSLISSSLSPAEIRDKLFDILFETLNPDRVFFHLQDDSGKQKLSSQKFKNQIRERGLVQISKTVVQHVLHNRESILVRSSRQDDRFGSRMSITEQKVESFICSPIIRQDRVLGMLYADRLGPRFPAAPFEDHDLKLLSAIAAQFGIAYENAVMYEKSVQFSDKLSSLNEAACSLSESLDAGRIVQTGIEAASRILECDKCSVLIWDKNLGALKMAYSNWIPQVEWASVVVKSGEGLSGRVFAENAPLLGTGSSTKYRTNSFLIVPIAMREDRPIGVITAADRFDERPFDEQDKALLTILAKQMGTCILSSSLELTRKLHQQELAIANDIQSRLLPKQMPALPGYDLAVHYQPKEAVGGDYYDLVRLDENRLGIVIADVCGKGIPASLIMTEVRAFVHVMSSVDHSPKELLRRLNMKLHPDLPRNLFVTALYGILDCRAGSWRFASCGHNPPYLHRKSTGKVEEIGSDGMVLGPDVSSRFDQALQETLVMLEAGDRLVLYSDGLVEATNAQGEMFESRIQKALPGLQSADSAGFVASLLRELDGFRGPKPLPDDLTLVTVRRAG